jgi:predicted amidohydrolase
LNLTVAAIQTSPIFGALRDNVDAALAQLPDDCDLAVLPELFSTGYQFRDRAEALAMAEEIPGGPTCARLREAAAGRKLHLIAGLAEKAADQLFNSAVLFRPDGTWGLYRKVHLFWNEKDIFSPGDLGLPVFPVLGTQLGIMICFDWVFPEAARSLALAGATLLAHPSNLVLPHCPRSMPVRCLENRVFGITANRVGGEERTGQRLEFIGQSRVIDPDGEVIAACDATQTGVARAVIDPALAHQPLTPRNDWRTDRRPAAYRL